MSQVLLLQCLAENCMLLEVLMEEIDLEGLFSLHHVIYEIMFNFVSQGEEGATQSLPPPRFKPCPFRTLLYIKMIPLPYNNY